MTSQIPWINLGWEIKTCGKTWSEDTKNIPFSWCEVLRVREDASVPPASGLDWSQVHLRQASFERVYMPFKNIHFFVKFIIGHVRTSNSCLATLTMQVSVYFESNCRALISRRIVQHCVPTCEMNIGRLHHQIIVMSN